MPGTIGVTLSGAAFAGSDDFCYGMVLAAYLYTAVAGDRITEAYINCDTGAGCTVEVAAYTCPAGLPVTKATASAIITLDAARAWYGVTGLNLPLTAGVQYCIAFSRIDAVAVRFWYTSEASGASRDSSVTTLPATWTHGAYQSRSFGCYAVVSAGASAKVAVPIAFGGGPMPESLGF